MLFCPLKDLIIFQYVNIQILEFFAQTALYLNFINIRELILFNFDKKYSLFNGYSNCFNA